MIPLNEIVTSGLCIGCGLCESMAGSDRVQVRMTTEGVERPKATIPLDMVIQQQIYETCPGTQVHGLPDHAIDPEATLDDVWGYTLRISRGYSAEPSIRFMGATGGVLTALALYLIETNRVRFILHTASDPHNPLRNQAQISRTRADVLQAAGSRYGPSASLRNFLNILDMGEPFAYIGKPCDITAIRNLAKTDARVDEQCKYLLTLVCGGASKLTKSWDILDDFGITEDELTVFRYRGFGNPGLTRIETKDGRAFELTYQQLWEEQSKWEIQPRCKLCADAIGETADVVATDVWPGGAPTGEDAGFNGILARTRRGLNLVEEAVKDGYLTIDKELTARDMDVFQPHQVTLKEQVWARFVALRELGKPVPQRSTLRIKRLAQRLSEERLKAEIEGTKERVRLGRVGTEPHPLTKSP